MDEVTGQPPAITVSLSTSQRGTWAEMVAVAFLIGRGHEVFVGAGLTSCDLVSLKDGELRRVEVKLARFGQRPSRKEETETPSVVGVKDALFDDLLVVLPDGTVLFNSTPEVVSRVGAPRGAYPAYTPPASAPVSRAEAEAFIAGMAWEGPPVRAGCPDNGTCHHGCAERRVETCYRVQSCAPLSGVFRDNVWPTDGSVSLAPHA